jgi:hypothetical protein
MGRGDGIRDARLSDLPERKLACIAVALLAILFCGADERPEWATLAAPGHRQLGAVSRPSARLLLAGFGHGGHSLFIGGQPLVSHLADM